MLERHLDWDTFDIWYTPRDHLYLEERCIEGLIDRFRARFGDRNVRVNHFPHRIASSYCAIQPECVIVEHVLSGRWCLWSTNDHAGYVLFTTLFERPPDWSFYGAGFWNWRPASLLCAYLPSARRGAHSSPTGMWSGCWRGCRSTTGWRRIGFHCVPIPARR